MHVSNSRQKRNGEKRQNTTSCMLSAQLLEIHQHGGPEKDFSDTSGWLALLPSPAMQKGDSPTAVPTAPGRPRPYPFPRAIATAEIAQAAPRVRGSGSGRARSAATRSRRPRPRRGARRWGRAAGGHPTWHGTTGTHAQHFGPCGSRGGGGGGRAGRRGRGRSTHTEAPAASPASRPGPVRDSRDPRPSRRWAPAAPPRPRALAPAGPPLVYQPAARQPPPAGTGTGTQPRRGRKAPAPPAGRGQLRLTRPRRSAGRKAREAALRLTLSPRRALAAAALASPLAARPGPARPRLTVRAVPLPAAPPTAARTRASECVGRGGAERSLTSPPHSPLALPKGRGNGLSGRAAPARPFFPGGRYGSAWAGGAGSRAECPDVAGLPLSVCLCVCAPLSRSRPRACAVGGACGRGLATEGAAGPRDCGRAVERLVRVACRPLGRASAVGRGGRERTAARPRPEGGSCPRLGASVAWQRGDRLWSFPEAERAAAAGGGVCRARPGRRAPREQLLLRVRTPPSARPGGAGPC